MGGNFEERRKEKACFVFPWDLSDDDVPIHLFCRFDARRRDVINRRDMALRREDLDGGKRVAAGGNEDGQRREIDTANDKDSENSPPPQSQVLQLDILSLDQMHCSN